MHAEERGRESKRRQIASGASTVLFEKGFRRTSVSDIAAACDMSTGQLYHYISSKDDILFLMDELVLERWGQCVAGAGFDAIRDPVARLEHAVRISARFLLQNRALVSFVTTELRYVEDERLRGRIESDSRNAARFYRRLLADIPSPVACGDNADLVADLVALLCTFPSMHGCGPGTDGEEECARMIDVLTGFILRAVGAR
jgi:AcrR family transcriptional regulator